jgi:hypothetical protein
MARIYGEIVASGLMTFDKSFSRSNGQPLDSTEIFYSLAAAQDYAKTDVAYVGQKIAVVEAKDGITVVTHYSIEPDNSLKALGSSAVGDESTIAVSKDGTVGLYGIDDLELTRVEDDGNEVSITYQPLYVNGKLTWVEPSAITVDSIVTRLEDEIARAKAAEEKNATDIALILDSPDDGVIDSIKEFTKYIEDHGDVATGLQNQIDENKNAITGKVDAEDGKGLSSNDLTDTLLAKINRIADGAQVNIIDSVDDSQFGIDENKKLTLLDIAIGKVTGLQDALDDKASKGTTLAEYGITDAYTKEETLDKIAEKITEINGGETAGEVLSQLNSYKEINDTRVETVETKLETVAEGAQVNVLEGVKLGDTLLNIVDKVVTITVGAGLKASEEVTVAEDGTLGVGAVNLSKLVQNDDMELVLDGGGAV